MKGPASRSSRDAVRDARTIVVKIGSKSLLSTNALIEELAADLTDLVAKRRRVIVVTSGAIALGTRKLGYRTRPKEVAKLQAAAAAGQSLLMRAYEEAFKSTAVAQVLLTHADLADRTRSNNARDALAVLLERGAVPILNENDSVAVEEIKFGDNDQLSSMVVPLVDADALLLLSDVDGLLDGRGKRVPFIEDVVGDAMPLATNKKSDVGTGGMTSKLEAVRRATLAGAHTVLASAKEPHVVRRVLEGEDLGTYFAPAAKRLSARKHWIAFTLRARGDIVVDAGCERAVRERGKSILAVGVLGVRGEFRAGDAVRILDRDGKELGRGLARGSVIETALIAGRSGEPGATVVVHRDELVLV